MVYHALSTLCILSCHALWLCKKYVVRNNLFLFYRFIWEYCWSCVFTPLRSGSTSWLNLISSVSYFLIFCRNSLILKSEEKKKEMLIGLFQMKSWRMVWSFSVWKSIGKIICCSCIFLFTPLPDFLGVIIFSAYPKRGFSDEVVLFDYVVNFFPRLSNNS